MEGFGKRQGAPAAKWETAKTPANTEASEQLDIDLIKQLLKKDAALRDLLMEAYGIIALDPDAKDDEPLKRSFEEIKERIDELQPGRGKKMNPETIRKFLASPKNGLA